MKDNRARYGSLAAGMAGALTNLLMVARFGVDSPVFLFSALAGIFGVAAIASSPVIGALLVLAGLLPALLPVALACWVGPLAIPFFLPTILMLAGAWRVAGTCPRREAPTGLRDLRFQCDRCGVWFAPYPNPWHDAGFCSRKCLECAR